MISHEARGRQEEMGDMKRGDGRKQEDKERLSEEQ